MPRCATRIRTKPNNLSKQAGHPSRWLTTFLICLALTCLAGISVAQEPSFDIKGKSRVISTSKKITGEATGSALSTARTGDDFHIIVKNLPSDEPLQLELGFVDLEKTKAGERLFDLEVNDKQALTGFDIINEAGGPLKSVVRRFTITPSDGEIDFHFTGLAGDAAISYIRITENGINLLISAPAAKADLTGLANGDDDYLPADAKAPFNVEEGTIDLDSTTETWNSGVPIGGFGTGKFELLPNGQFGNLTINNSWDLPVLRPRGTFLAVGAKASSSGGGGRILQVNPADPRGNKIFSDYPSMTDGKYTGKFPFGQVDLTDEKLPLEVTIEGWSPVIPYNAEDSSLPAGVINVVVRNPQKYPVSTAVAFSWEDVNGRGGSLLPDDQHGFVAPSVHKDAATSEVTGFQISTTHIQNDRAASFTGDLFVGTTIEGVAVTRNLSWNPRSGKIPWWKSFTNNLRLDKIPSSPKSVTGKTDAGPMSSTLCVSFNLAPKEARRVPFIVAWYAPKIVTLDSASGEPSVEEPDYAHRFGSSVGVASYLAIHRKEFRAKTDEWVDMIDRSSIPPWAKTHTLNSLFPMHSNSIYLKEKRFAMLESPADMRGMLGPVDLKLGSDDFLLTMFPDLQKTELNLYARAQKEDGRIPRYVGNIHGALSGFDQDLLGAKWYDPTASWLLELARYWRETGDEATRNALKPAIEKAQSFLVNELAKDTTSDINVFSELGESTSAGAMSKLKALAGLQASQVLLEENSSAIANLIAAHSNSLHLDETSSTFAATLAGEYGARAAGLPGVVSTEQAEVYLANVIANDFTPSRPVPRMQPASTDASNITALPPLQSYVGALGLILDQRDIGIEPFLRMFQVAYAAQKAPWKQALLYDAPAGARPQYRYHRSSMAAWSLWRGLSGVVYDQPNQRLYIKPTPITSATLDMELPVFTPAFWGWLKYNAAASTGTLAITKVTGSTTPTLTAIATGISMDGNPENMHQFNQPLLLEEGATINFNGWPDKPGGTATAEPPPPPILPGVEQDEETSGSLELSDEKTTSSAYESQSSPETADGEVMPLTEDDTDGEE